MELDREELTAKRSARLGYAYVLLGDRAVPVDLGAPGEHARWAEFMADIEGRRVALDELPTGDSLSTVFLGVDQEWQALPVLWETWAEGLGVLQRYDSAAAARAGHARILRTLRASLGGAPLRRRRAQASP